jgi:hypothetical protein
LSLPEKVIVPSQLLRWRRSKSSSDSCHDRRRRGSHRALGFLVEGGGENEIAAAGFLWLCLGFLGLLSVVEGGGDVGIAAASFCLARVFGLSWFFKAAAM